MTRIELGNLPVSPDPSTVRWRGHAAATNRDEAKGILGKKLGMSQVFDPETGAMTAVTVIEAGPCPVVQVKTAESTATTPCSSRSSAVAERKLSKPEVGHLKKAGFGPHRHLVELRGESDLAVGETVTVESFEPGDRVKVSGISIGKGFQGTIKRHGFTRGPVSHGSHNVRKPGSIGASAYPSRVFKGMKMSGRMGGDARHPARPRRARGRSRAQPPARPGLGSGPGERDRGDPERVMAARPKAPVLGGSKARRSRSRRRSSPPRSSRTWSTRRCAPS